MNSDKYGAGMNRLAVGQSRVVTEADIAADWGGIDPEFSPANAVSAVQSILPREAYERLYPYRIGSEKWHQFVSNQPNYNKQQRDYYSYDNLIAAVTEVANIKYKLEYIGDDAESSRVFRLDKATLTETLIYESSQFANDAVAIRSQIVDFGSFIKEGTERERKRELAAFLANISHETGGGSPDSPDGPLAWGLYWNEEIAYMNTTTVNYIAEHDNFPAYPGKSYHGRGPIQLSWNYNYGLISGIIYGAKDILLQEPELIVQDGRIAFMTAILFWMTPQPPKPSAHDVMVGNWIPSEADIEKGLTPPGFGITIMIINGNLECDLDESDRRVGRRIGFYQTIAGNMNMSVEGEKLNTVGMRPFQYLAEVDR